MPEGWASQTVGPFDNPISEVDNHEGGTPLPSLTPNGYGRTPLSSETFDLRMVDGGTRGFLSCWLPLQSSIASLLRNILGLERRTFPTRPTDHVCNLQRVPPTNMNVFDLH